jgi:hypothetical protein
LIQPLGSFGAGGVCHTCDAVILWRHGLSHATVTWLVALSGPRSSISSNAPRFCVMSSTCDLKLATVAYNCTLECTQLHVHNYRGSLT